MKGAVKGAVLGAMLGAVRGTAPKIAEEADGETTVFGVGRRVTEAHAFLRFLTGLE